MMLEGRRFAPPRPARGMATSEQSTRVLERPSQVPRLVEKLPWQQQARPNLSPP